jgi:2-iminobutanoate/2-iminopropanoate deaminase
MSLRERRVMIFAQRGGTARIQMPDKEIIATEAAPAAIGPYSQAVRAGGFVFLSGQIPLDPVTGDMVGKAPHDVEAQTRQVLKNLEAVLTAAGTSFDKVVRATIYLTDLADFAKVNAIYGERFPNHSPARATVQVAALPREANVEIDLVAIA